MSYLLDTGILLRLVDDRDQQHAIITRAVRTLVSRREELLIATQNVAEFCNVTTRPINNNGLGLAPRNVLDLLEKEIEPICSVLAEPSNLYADFKRLVATYGVIGKQVHDARLVAMMLVWRVENLLTLNDRDFRRYEPEGIKIITPASILTPGP